MSMQFPSLKTQKQLKSLWNDFLKKTTGLAVTTSGSVSRWWKLKFGPAWVSRGSLHDPKTPCYCVWGPDSPWGESDFEPVFTRSKSGQPPRWSPGPWEEVGGLLLGMLWRTRILRDVLFFVNCSEKWCVRYVCVCVLFGCRRAFPSMLSSSGRR